MCNIHTQIYLEIHKFHKRKARKRVRGENWKSKTINGWGSIEGAREKSEIRKSNNSSIEGVKSAVNGGRERERRRDKEKLSPTTIETVAIQHAIAFNWFAS